MAGFKSFLAFWLGGSIATFGGSANLGFGLSISGNAKETISGIGNTTFPFSIASSSESGIHQGFRSFLGFWFGGASYASPGLTYLHQLAGQGNVHFSGSGDLSYPLSSNGFCKESLRGSGDLPFSFSMQGAQGIKTACHGNGVLLGWDLSTGATGYNLYRGTSPGSYDPVPTNVGNALEWTVKGLPSNLYYFAVKAYNTGGELSGYSNEISVSIAGLYYQFSAASTGKESFKGIGGPAFVFALAAVGDTNTSGAATLTYGVLLAGQGKESFAGTASLSYGFLQSGNAKESFIGSGDLAFTIEIAGQDIPGAYTGSGDLAYLIAFAGSGWQPVTASGGLVWGITIDGTGAEKVITGPGSNLSYSIVMAGAGRLDFAATGDLAFVCVLAADGTRTSTTAGDLQYLFALSVSGSETFAGKAQLVYGFAVNSEYNVLEQLSGLRTRSLDDRYFARSLDDRYSTRALDDLYSTREAE